MFNEMHPEDDLSSWNMLGWEHCMIYCSLIVITYLYIHWDYLCFDVITCFSPVKNSSSLSKNTVNSAAVYINRSWHIIWRRRRRTRRREREKKPPHLNIRSCISSKKHGIEGKLYIAYPTFSTSRLYELCLII